MISSPFAFLAYHLDLALACLEAWETAPARPRLEPEVDPVMRARRHAPGKRASVAVIEENP